MVIQMEQMAKKDSSLKAPDQKKRFADFMQKLKDEGKLSEYSEEAEKAARDQDRDWDVLLK